MSTSSHAERAVTLMLEIINAGQVYVDEYLRLRGEVYRSASELTPGRLGEVDRVVRLLGEFGSCSLLDAIAVEQLCGSTQTRLLGAMEEVLDHIRADKEAATEKKELEAEAWRASML